MTNAVLLLSWRTQWGANLLRFLKQRAASKADVEDLEQETYLRLLRAPKLDDVRNPRAYLLTIASHVLTEWRHKRVPAGMSVDDLPDLLTDERTPDLGLDAWASQARLDDCLNSLRSPTMRAVLLLRLRDDLSYREISSSLSISERQVKRYLARGYDSLRIGFEAAGTTAS